MSHKGTHLAYIVHSNGVRAKSLNLELGLDLDTNAGSKWST